MHAYTEMDNLKAEAALCIKQKIEWVTMKAMSSYFTPIPIPIFSIIPHLLPVPTFQPGNWLKWPCRGSYLSDFPSSGTVVGELRLQLQICSIPPMVQLLYLAHDAGTSVLALWGSLVQPACQATQGASLVQENKVHEKTLLIYVCNTFCLLCWLGGQMVPFFFFFQDSKMNHTFCLRSSIYVSLEMWSLFSLLQTWARCFSVVHIYEYGFLSVFPFLSPPPFFFSSSLTFLSFSCSVWIYGSSQTKGIYSFCRRKVVRGKALRSSVLSGDYFHINVSRCPLSAIVLSRECFMFWELQIVLV